LAGLFAFFLEPQRPFERIIIEAFASVRRSRPISAAKSGFRQEFAGRLCTDEKKFRARSGGGDVRRINCMV
jgi:hypothetical protein